MLCHMDQAQGCLKNVSEQPRTPVLIFLTLFSLSQFFIFTTLTFFEMNSLTPFTLNWLQFCWFYTPTRYLWYGFLNNFQLDQQYLKAVPTSIIYVLFCFFLFLLFLISVFSYLIVSFIQLQVTVGQQQVCPGTALPTIFM